MGCEAGGEALGGAKESVGHETLKRPEGGAVDGVDNDRNARAMGSPAPQNTRLAAVRVDDVGPGRAEFTGQGKQGAKVVERMDGAHEGRDDGKKLRERREGGFEGTFRPAGGAGEEAHLDAGALIEAQDGGDGVFLGAANDQACDDVGDPHSEGEEFNSLDGSCR